VACGKLEEMNGGEGLTYVGATYYTWCALGQTCWHNISVPCGPLCHAFISMYDQQSTYVTHWLHDLYYSNICSMVVSVNMREITPGKGFLWILVLSIPH